MSAIFQKVLYENKESIIMRDDLNHPIFSGNKARKLAYILNNPKKYSKIKTIVSFGGNQSNFMLALSQLAKLKDWDFHYWIKPLPNFLKLNKNGNLKLALKNKMQLFETKENLSLKNIQDKYQKQEDIHFFDQGGRNAEAEEGLAECALEIQTYCNANSIDKYSVVVASGTGTTALFLEKYLPKKVYTIPCIGDSNYLIQQFNNIDNSLAHPEILQSSSKSNFGELKKVNYQTYKSLLEQTNIEFDLLYDPIAWQVLLENYSKLTKPIIYIHCGGVSGNETMLARYKRFLTQNNI